MPATIDIPSAARLLGVSKNTAYEEVARTGELAGCKVISVGRRLLIPRAHFEKALGITTTDQTTDVTESS